LQVIAKFFEDRILQCQVNFFKEQCLQLGTWRKKRTRIFLSRTTSLILKYKLTGKERALGSKFGKHEAKLRQIWDINGKSRRAFEIRDEAKRISPQGICKKWTW
jgi:hypothetical protein